MNPLDLYFELRNGQIKMAQVLSETVSEDSDAGKTLNTYVAMLRLVYLVHQNSHWKCKCNSFYGNHLMFQRLYEDALARLDGSAEKLIGIFGNDCLDVKQHASLIGELMDQFCSDDQVKNSLEVEKAFQKISDVTYNKIKELNKMTLGLDDMIMANHSASETATYLLQQTFA